MKIISNNENNNNEIFIKPELRAWHAAQNSNINYTHVETPLVKKDNNNDYNQLKSQEANLAQPTLHHLLHYILL